MVVGRLRLDEKGKDLDGIARMCPAKQAKRDRCPRYYVMHCNSKWHRPCVCLLARRISLGGQKKEGRHDSTDSAA